MTDPDLLAAAIAACGASNRGFALRVLSIADSSVRRVLVGTRRLNGTERIVCRAIVAHPEIVSFLMDASADNGAVK